MARLEREKRFWTCVLARKDDVIIRFRTLLRNLELYVRGQVDLGRELDGTMENDCNEKSQNEANVHQRGVKRRPVWPT